MIERIRRWFFKLNLFDDDSTDERKIEEQRFTTRLYIVLILIFLVLISFVCLIMERSIIGHASSPSESTFQHLSSAYSSTLQCPCRELSVRYRSFVHIQYHLHQVCSSGFITDEWIQSISIDADHLEMSFFWQIIAGFCRLSQTSIETTIDQFFANGMFNVLAIDENLLRFQTQTAFDTLLIDTRSLFFRNLIAVQRITTGNQFASGLGTNFNAKWSINGEQQSVPVLTPRTFGNCSCLNMNGCPRSSIDGIVSDCLMMNGVLQSSFQCYFNQTCLSQLHPSVMSSVNELNLQKNHQSNISSTVQELLERFLLDQLIIGIDFTAYYQQCQPSYCLYSYRQRFDLIYALTTIIGIFSGLNMVLRFMSQLITKKLFSRRIVPIQESSITDSSISNRINTARLTLWQNISSFNLFRTRLANEEQLTRQRLTTRVFIVLMILAVIVSGTYIFFSIQPQVITILHPSLKIYVELYQNYSTTLFCPCSQISIPYKKFLMINYTLHQICSSTFVSSSWLGMILAFDQSKSIDFDSALIDFRRVAPSYFQLIATVCSLVQNTFNEALHVLGESYSINPYLPSQSQFLEQMSILNATLTTSIQQEFLTIQNWLHLITIQSQLFVGLSINGYLAVIDGTNVVEITDANLLHFAEVTEENVQVINTCSCRQLVKTCQAVAFLDEINTIQSYPFRFFVGMNVGCVPWLGLLLTDTNWWYRTDIIEQIRLIFGDNLRNQSDPIITPLSNQTETRFRITNGSHPLFEILLREALLEQWNGNLTRFDLFYDECAPKECIYILQSRRSRLAALLLLISICGGLNQVLRWFTLVVFQIVFYLTYLYRHQRGQDGWMIFETMRQSLVKLNLFQSRSTEASHIQRERQQTRLYLCLLFVAVSILIVYPSLTERAVVETIDGPSNSTEYESLRQRYGDTLECLCTRISLEYNVIIPKLEIESFHPVCNSSFTDPYLYNLLGIFFNLQRKRNQDFREVILPFFRLIDTLCYLARNQTSYSLSTFLSSTTVINRLISAERFKQQLNNTVTQLQQQIPAEFAQTLESIRLSQQGNALISVLSSNWQYLVENENRTLGAPLAHQQITYENGTCSCALSQHCSMSATLFNAIGDAYYSLNELRLGCTILESVLGSSLECFYSDTCVHRTITALFVGHSTAGSSPESLANLFSPINNSLSTFADDDTMETIANRMFINRWQYEISYEAFVQGCAVRECTYTYHYRFDPLDVITTFLSVFGSLSIGLHFLVPHLFSIRERFFLDIDFDDSISFFS